MKNLNNVYQKVREKGHVFYNLNHNYQPSLLEVKDFELVESTEKFLPDTEYDFRKQLATYVLAQSELLQRNTVYLGIHWDKGYFNFSLDEDVETLDSFLNHIDYEQLRQDKLKLLESGVTDDTGIIELIDSIQDIACRRGIRPEKDIFLYEEEEN